MVGDIHSEKLVVEMMCNILFGHNLPANTGRAAEFCNPVCSAGVCWPGGLCVQRMRHIQLHHQLLTVLLHNNCKLCTHLLIIAVLGVQLLPGANPQRRVDNVHGGDGGDGGPASRLQASLGRLLNK